ncbi:MAG TPA: ATP-binding protein, partial [Myxococcaceae bacterium]|nr:ATP-binding protein [Myxococcaceae bacterium]
WGALEVARRLEGTWPGLLRLREQGEVRGSQAWALDALSAVKAQRAISSEIVLSELLRTLMRVALENAGAQRGALLWVEGEQVVVESTAGPEQVEVGRRPLTPELLPTSLVAYVRRTGEAVILGSEADRARFSNDSYLRARRPRSVLCLPIFHQRRLVGLLDLENALTPGVFTAGRLAVLEQISAQAAISLENARLYETLERERSLLQAILDHSPAAIYVKDPQGRYLLVNQRLEGLFRRSREAIVGGTDLGLPLDRDAVDEIREHDREVLESGTPRTWEEEVRLYGESRTYLSMKFPLRKGKGPVYAVGGIATDITERKREELAERLLAESGRKLAASLEYESTLKTAVGLGVPELAEGCLLYLAGGEESLAWGALATAPEGAELLHGGAAPVALLESLWQERAVQGPVDRVLWEGLEPGPRERLEALAPRWGLYVPLLAHGSRLGGLCLLRCQRAPDERDLALAEELGRRVALALDNARLYRRAQEAIALRDDFLVVASHELRTPLTPLRLQLRRMEQVVCREQPEAPLARMLEGGLRQVDRLERLVKDLLDVSRLSSGRLQLQLEEVDLGELVEAVAARFERLLEQSGSALRLRVERGVRGRWDGGRVEQVVENLLGNAIKFGEGRPIEMTVEEAPEVARLTVRDHGRGIAGEYHQRIFGRFERAVPTRHYGGLGLGLYITRQLVEAHGGSIQVSSEPGAGATFTVELPRSAPVPRG